MRRTFLACALVFIGCSFDAVERATEYQDMFASETQGDASSAETGDGGGGSSPVATVTGDPGPGDPGSPEPTTSGSTTSASETDEPASPPQLLGCTATPASVLKPGPVELALEVSGGVDEVDLALDGQHVVTLGAGELTHVWEILSDDDNGDPRTWTATARGPGGEASCDIHVAVQLQPGGQPAWHKQLVPDGDFSFGQRVAVGPGDEVYVIGYRFVDGLPRMIVRLYIGGEEQWTWTPADWSAKPGVASAASAGADIKVLADGDLIVAGNLNDLGQRYVARLRPTSPPTDRAVWESMGNVGELAVGLGVDEAGNVALAGDAPRPGEETPQLAVWGWDANGHAPWLKYWSTGVPKKTEHGAGVTFVRDRVVVVGQAEIGDGGDVQKRQRAVALTMTPTGLLLNEWLSPGDFGADGALDVDTVGDEFCFTGWAEVPRRALTRCSDDLVPAAAFLDPSLGVGVDISHNRAGEAVIVGERAGQVDQQFVAFAQALRPGLSGQHWLTILGEPGSRANGVACDTWGACVWTGYVLDAGAWQCVTGGLTP